MKNCDKGGRRRERNPPPSSLSFPRGNSFFSFSTLSQIPFSPFLLMEIGIIALCIAIALLVFCPALYNYTGNVVGFYEQSNVAGVIRLPTLVFPIVWWFLYLAIVAAEVVHLIYAAGSIVASVSSITVAVLCLFVANIVFNHWWSICFFRYTKRRVYRIISIIDIIFLLASALTITVLYGVETSHSQYIWASFALFLPYDAWLVVATVLNFNWVVKLWNYDKFGKRIHARTPVAVN
jgi:tryptophan-rich sensory protein